MTAEAGWRVLREMAEQEPEFLAVEEELMQLLAAQHGLPGPVPASPEETLATVDAAVEGRCAGPGCSAILTERSPSAYWCSPGCQESWQRMQANRPAEVRGTAWVGSDPARWRPGLVTEAAVLDMELVTEQPHGDGMTARWYRYLASGRQHLRLDDGHRFVGADIPDDADLLAQAELLNRLERELTDPRRLDPDPDGVEMFPFQLAAMYERHRSGVEAWDREHAPPPRAEGGVFWLPNPPADPEAPTAAELAGGVDLSPYLAQVGARPTFTWVDETNLTAAPPHRWRERVDLVLAGDSGSPEVVTGHPGAGRPRVPVNTMVLAEIVVPPSSRLARLILAGWRRLRRGARAVDRWLCPLAHCPGHGRRECFPCDWPGQDVVDALARAHQGRRPPRLRASIRVDTRRFEEGMAQASEAFRRAGEEMVQSMAGLGPVLTAVTQAVEAESDRLALRATCTDEAMYERALAAVRERGWSVRQMAEAVAAGRYTEEGWADLDRTAQAVGATWEELLAHARALEDSNPPTRFDAGTAVIETLRSQAPRSQTPDGPVGGLLGVPVIPDGSLAPDSWRLEYADGQRLESHVCQWEATAWRGALSVEYRCRLRWSDGTPCDSVTAFPADLRRTERLVSGISATGGAS